MFFFFSVKLYLLLVENSFFQRDMKFVYSTIAIIALEKVFIRIIGRTEFVLQGISFLFYLKFENVSVESSLNSVFL